MGSARIYPADWTLVVQQEENKFCKMPSVILNQKWNQSFCMAGHHLGIKRGLFNLEELNLDVSETVDIVLGCPWDSSVKESVLESVLF